MPALGVLRKSLENAQEIDIETYVNIFNSSQEKKRYFVPVIILLSPSSLSSCAESLTG